jgi:hypothetical protein
MEDDGLVNWVIPKNMSFLSSDIDTDALSVMLRYLIMEVKNDHSKMQYRKDLRNYGRQISQIVSFVRKNGYNKQSAKDKEHLSAYEEILKISLTDEPNDSDDSDDIMDSYADSDAVVEGNSFLGENAIEEDYSDIVDV